MATATPVPAMLARLRRTAVAIDVAATTAISTAAVNVEYRSRPATPTALTNPSPTMPP